MARFDDIQKGKKARKSIELPLPLDAETAEVPRADLVVLAGDEESAALKAAAVYARGCGSTDPKEGDPHYDLGLMVHTLVRACVDPDVPGSFAFYFCSSAAPEDFELAAAKVLRHFDRERIQFLYQQQQIWQEECSPWGKGDTEDQILSKLFQLRGEIDPARPFKLWRLATVGSLLLTTVNRLAVLLEGKWEPGSSSGSSSSGQKSENGSVGALSGMADA